MNEIKTKEVPPQRTLKLYQGVVYGIGCGIGGSIFVLLGTGIDIAQSGILISLILGGVLIFFTALNYAELSTSLPIAGGAYNFTKEGIGGFLAFIIGFFLWIANTATCAFSAQTFGLVINEVFKRFGVILPNIYVILIAVIPILLVSIVFFRTQKIAIKNLLILTFILIGMFGFFIFAGLFIAPFTNITDFNPSYLTTTINFGGIIPAFLLLFIFFTTITSNIAYLTADLKNPSKNIPKLNIFSILITLIIYLSVTVVVLINIGNTTSGFSETSVLLAVVFENVLGPFGFFFMIVAAMISTIVMINAALGSAVSVITALARDRFISTKFRETKKRHDMPFVALLVTATLSITISTFAGIGLTAEMTNLIYFIGLAFVNYAAVKLRRGRKELDRPFKAPFFPVLPIFNFICFLIFAVILGVVLSLNALILGIIISAVGLAYYLLAIADKPSKVLTISGMKFLLMTILSLTIFSINNFSLVYPELVMINRVLIGISVFTIFTIVFDLLPLREIAYFFIKKIDKGKVAINLGGAQIINLGKRRAKIIHFINILLSLAQFVSVGIILYIVFLFTSNSLLLNDIIVYLGPQIIELSALPLTNIFISILVFFGLILFFSGILLWIGNRELKSLGI